MRKGLESLFLCYAFDIRVFGIHALVFFIVNHLYFVLKDMFLAVSKDRKSVV